MVSGGVAAARTAAGSVESIMRKRGDPAATPRTARITSGARLDPPMPSSTTSVNPSSLTASANAMMRSTCPAISAGDRIHPSRLAIFCWTAGSELHAAGSARQSCSAARTAAGPDSRSAAVSGPGENRNE